MHAYAYVCHHRQYSDVFILIVFVSLFLTYRKHGCELEIELTRVDGPDYCWSPRGNDPTSSEALEVHVTKRKNGGDEDGDNYKDGDDEFDDKDDNNNYDDDDDSDDYDAGW